MWNANYTWTLAAVFVCSRQPRANAMEKCNKTPRQRTKPTKRSMQEAHTHTRTSARTHARARTRQEQFSRSQQTNSSFDRSYALNERKNEQKRADYLSRVYMCKCVAVFSRSWHWFCVCSLIILSINTCKQALPRKTLHQQERPDSHAHKSSRTAMAVAIVLLRLVVIAGRTLDHFTHHPN